MTREFCDDWEGERANCRPGKAGHGCDKGGQEEGEIVPPRDAMLLKKRPRSHNERLSWIRGKRRNRFLDAYPDRTGEIREDATPEPSLFALGGHSLVHALA